MLTNVSRHAEAKAVRVALVASDDDVTLTVEDDGIGPPAEGTRTGGRGLDNLATRARWLGGFDSSLGRARAAGSVAEWRIPRQGTTTIGHGA